MKRALDFLLKPLIEFLELNEGERIYQYLYFTRSGVESEVESAILHGNHNITVVGKPGMGKTSLMHYIFIELKKRSNLYPIILDYRKLTPKKPEALLSLFVQEARRYFKEIGYPVNQITEETILSNCYDHSMIIQQHLARIPFNNLKKKMVLFLDDLDYADNDYMTILKDYFLPYAQTDKANLILSVRPPLLNTIKRFDQLRQYYHVYPREIHIPEDDLEFIMNNRLKSILEREEIVGELGTNFEKSSIVQKFLKVFRHPTLDELVLSKLREYWPEFTSETIRLPFDSNFYSKLKNITFSNLRIVEEMLPELLEWEATYGASEKSLNQNFYDAYIQINAKKNHILLDLVNDKTRDKKTKFDSNSILQNVLEYFYFEEAVNDFFYKEMERFGISKENANKAIEILIRTPYSLIVPEFVYIQEETEVSCLIQKYEINKKGIQYIENILRNDLYYSMPNEYSKKYNKTNRSYYEERMAVEQRATK